MKEIKPTEIPCNVIEMIGRDWILVTAGDKHSFNTMRDTLKGVSETQIKKLLG